MKKRATLIVLDSVGIGYLPDAVQFGDEGAHTLGHIYDRTHMKIPNMLELGQRHRRHPKSIVPSFFH